MQQALRPKDEIKEVSEKMKTLPDIARYGILMYARGLSDRPRPPDEAGETPDSHAGETS